MQRVLDMGARSHYLLLHGRHEADVVIATLSKQGWNQSVYDHVTAMQAMVGASELPINSYVSQNGFDGRRKVTDVCALTSCFVDLDTYKHETLAGVTPDNILELIRHTYPWLPSPTLLADSGRGAYLIWVFTQPLPNEWLYRWQLVEIAIVDLLSKFAADPMAKDAARVLRIADSWHTVAKKHVVYRQIADPIRFQELEKALPAKSSIRQPNLPTKPIQASKKSSFVESVDASTLPTFGTVETIRRMYKLHQDRLGDLNTLARRRAPMTDYRHRTLFSYACSLAYYAHSKPDLIRELSLFAEQYFHHGGKYAGRMTSVVDRFNAHQRGKKYRDPINDQWVDPRYRLKNQTIIGMLDITGTEQHQLKTIIGKEEKNRRLTERRRQKGIKEREQYRQEVDRRTDEKRQLALKLAAGGMKQRDIAERLEIGRSRVSQLLK